MPTHLMLSGNDIRVSVYSFCTGHGPILISLSQVAHLETRVLSCYGYGPVTSTILSQKKFPPLNCLYQVPLSNLNRFSGFYTAEKRTKFAT